MNRRRQLSHAMPLPLTLALLVGACTIVGHEKVEGWPELTVREHHVPHAVMRDKCSPFVPALMSPEACAIFDLRARTCDIYYSADFPPSDAVIRHERLHCAGNDHVGGTYLKQLLEAAQ
jgi:hypothetical protein